MALEQLTAVKRAGADTILTYFAKEVAAMVELTHNEESLSSAASGVIPGGVNSPVRAFRSVGGTPYFVARAEGAYVWDVEGTRFIDYVQSYGASILGHAHPAVIEAIRAAAGRRHHLRRADRGRGACWPRSCAPGCPASSRCDWCRRAPRRRCRRSVSPGAPRVDRKIVKFAGNYHGHSDALLAAGGSGVADQGLTGAAA